VQREGRLADPRPAVDHRDRRRSARRPLGERSRQRVELGAAAGEVRDVGGELADRRHDDGGPRDGPGLVTVQYPLVQVTKLGTRLDPQLVDDDLADALVGPQRLGLPAAADLGEHQVLPEPFVQRVFLDELGQLADERGVPAEREVGGDPRVQRRQPLLGEPRRLRGDRRRRRHVGVRRVPPECERARELLGRLFGVAVAHRPLRAVDRGLELLQVGVGGPEHEPVTGGDGGEHAPFAVVEEAAQPQDVAVDLGGRRLRRAVTPQLQHDLVDGEHLVCADEQGREQEPGLGRADPGPPRVLSAPGVSVHPQRPQEPEPHVYLHSARVRPNVLPGPRGPGPPAGDDTHSYPLSRRTTEVRTSVRLRVPWSAAMK
jgi:hypothetical protein